MRKFNTTRKRSNVLTAIGLISMPLFAFMNMWAKLIRPGIVTFSLFIIVSVVFQLSVYLRVKDSMVRLCFGLQFFGGALNAIAVLSNGGFMPAMPIPKYPHGYGMWTTIDSSSKMLALCDILPTFGGFASAGDMVIFCGAVILFLGVPLRWAIVKIITARSAEQPKNAAG